jgi:hypothetical protein
MPSRTVDVQQRASYLAPIAVFPSLVACFTRHLISPAARIATPGLA